MTDSPSSPEIISATTAAPSFAESETAEAETVAKSVSGISSLAATDRYPKVLTLEEVIKGTDYPMTHPSLKAMYYFLGAAVLEFRQRPMLPGCSGNNDPSDYVTEVSHCLPYAPIINCIEEKRIPGFTERNVLSPSRGHFQYARFSDKEDKQRKALTSYWFIPDYSSIFQYNPQRFCALPTLYKFSPENNNYFLSGSYTEDVFNNAFIDGNCIYNDISTILSK